MPLTYPTQKNEKSVKGDFGFSFFSYLTLELGLVLKYEMSHL